MSVGIKLTVAALVLVCSICYLAYLGAASSWQYYLSVDEAVADAPRLFGKRLRVSGEVRSKSLTIFDDRRQARFDLCGESLTLHVNCHCAVPDNLAENIDVVVEGTLREEGMVGQKVITRCASKYQQKEIATVSRASIK